MPRVRLALAVVCNVLQDSIIQQFTTEEEEQARILGCVQCLTRLNNTAIEAAKFPVN